MVTQSSSNDQWVALSIALVSVLGCFGPTAKRGPATNRIFAKLQSYTRIQNLSSFPCSFAERERERVHLLLLPSVSALDIGVTGNPWSTIFAFYHTVAPPATYQSQRRACRSINRLNDSLSTLTWFRWLDRVECLRMFQLFYFPLAFWEHQPF
jgi:hypothetical protein